MADERSKYFRRLRRLCEWDAATPRPVVMVLLDRRERGTASNAG